MDSEPGAAASQSEIFRHNPHELHGRKLYYSNAIGTEPQLADVILDQVRDFEAKQPDAVRKALKSTPSAAPPLPLPPDGFSIGQIAVSPRSGGGWRLRHMEDQDASQPLTLFTAPEAAREIAMFDESGAFRPLKSAPNLKRGWQLDLADDEALRLSLDFLHPAALGFLEHQRHASLKPVHLRETLGRQTGMYRFTNSIRDDQAQDLIASVCHAGKCLRCITWKLDPDQPLGKMALSKLADPKRPATPQHTLPLLCVEACTHVVGAARIIAQRNHQKAGKDAGEMD
jgi:sirohydrochlorin cobaltochelatase